MTATRRLVVAALLSVVWAMAFVVGVERGALYPFLGVVAAVVVIVVAVIVATDRGATGVLRAIGPGHVVFVRDAGIGLAVGIVTVVLTHAGAAIAGPFLPGLIADVERLQVIAAVTPARLGVVVLIAVAEELLWRGLALDALRQRGLSVPAAMVVAAVVYGVSQFGPGSPWLVATGVGFGVLWGGLRVASGGLWMPIVAHVTWTVAILGVVPLQ